MSGERCDLCWETFNGPVELLLHEAVEDDRLYELDGYEPSTAADTQWAE